MTVNEVWRTRAGAILFNAITEMALVDQQGRHVYFSHRKEITERFIGMLLEGGLVPRDMTPLHKPVK